MCAQTYLAHGSTDLIGRALADNQGPVRTFRIGQTKNVQVHKFLCVGTLEEKIDETMQRENEAAEEAPDTGEGRLTELSTSQLKELFKLQKEAVVR